MEKVPAVVGVPDSSPVADKVRPAGSSDWVENAMGAVPEAAMVHW